MKKRYALVTGTRPQIIKSVPIIKAEKQTDEINIVHIFTGQHYDTYLADIFFRTLAVDPPEYQLDVGSGSTDYHIRMIIERLAPVLRNEELDGLLVPGDTNSALAAGLTGMFLSIPVVHIESGLRSYDLYMQEEINRRLIDHGSSILFAPTETAVQNLKNENVLGKIIATGDTMYDLLLAEKNKIMDMGLFNNTAARLNVNNKTFLMMTVHRRENLSNHRRLLNIIEAIGKTEIKTIFPIHPHSRKVIDSLNLKIPANIKLIDPLPYQDFLNLVAYSGLVLTDSGGLQKEAYLLNTPCVTLRTSSEWIETVKYKANRVVGTKTEQIINAINEMYNKKLKTDSSVYGDGKAAEKMIRELINNKPMIPTVPDLT